MEWQRLGRHSGQMWIENVKCFWYQQTKENNLDLHGIYYPSWIKSSIKWVWIQNR